MGHFPMARSSKSSTLQVLLSILNLPESSLILTLPSNDSSAHAADALISGDPPVELCFRPVRGADSREGSSSRSAPLCMCLPDERRARRADGS